MTRRLVAVALGTVGLALNPATVFADAGVLKIFDAEYGDAATHRLCDATQIVASLCDGKTTCTIQVGNELCGDPAFGTPKKLHVAFKCEGSAPEVFVQPEPRKVTVVCGNENRGLRT